MYRKCGNYAIPRRNTAEVAYATGDYDRAKKLCKECLNVNHELGDRRGTGLTLEILGRVARAQGEDIAAWSLSAQALALLSDAGDQWSVARCIESIAVICMDIDTWQATRLFGFAETLRLLDGALNICDNDAILVIICESPSHTRPFLLIILLSFHSSSSLGF